MRTTLDIDERVLLAAKSRARARGMTVGQALSELARLGQEAEEGSMPDVDSGDFPMLPPVPGHVITDDMVAKALAEDG